MKIDIVDDVKHAWRWFSVQMMALSLAIQGAWAVLGDDIKTYIPHFVAQGVSMLLLFLGIGGRMVKQNKPDGQ